jgi:4a-hydroxytetrahydrobiopterin dehydratase
MLLPVGTLSDDEVRTALAELPGWELAGGRIEKQYRFDGFPQAIAFVDRLAEAAEAADHHPDLDIRYDKVLVGLVTHSAGGITDKDVELAGAAEAAARG